MGRRLQGASAESVDGCFMAGHWSGVRVVEAHVRLLVGFRGDSDKTQSAWRAVVASGNSLFGSSSGRGWGRGGAVNNGSHAL